MGGYLEEVVDRFRDVAVIRGVFIDYLDLLKGEISYDMYRLELGQITMDLKVLAAAMRIPVVTLTQLNRQAYNDDNAKNKKAPTLAMMGESIKKVENADFVAMLQSEPDKTDGDQQSDLGTMKVFVGKNRSGAKSTIIDLRLNFPKFRLDDMKGVQITTFEEPELESDAIL